MCITHRNTCMLKLCALLLCACFYYITSDYLVSVCVAHTSFNFRILMHHLSISLHVWGCLCHTDPVPMDLEQAPHSCSSSHQNKSGCVYQNKSEAWPIKKRACENNSFHFQLLYKFFLSTLDLER